MRGAGLRLLPGALCSDAELHREELLEHEMAAGLGERFAVVWKVNLRERPCAWVRVER